jgi:very-short-patch-repair endonuclease
MSYKEALKDGIAVRNQGRNLYYSVPCTTCKKFFDVRYYHSIDLQHYKCSKCKEEVIVSEDLYLKAVKEVRFERAITRLEKVTKINDDYVVAIKKVAKNLHKKGWFQSTEEIMVAIVLLKNNIKIIHQQKIKNYKIDFVLPEHKIILEVDGEMYHSNKSKEGIRDGEILLSIGLDWRILRISTERINKDVTKIIEAI